MHGITKQAPKGLCRTCTSLPVCLKRTLLERSSPVLSGVAVAVGGVTAQTSTCHRNWAIPPTVFNENEVCATGIGQATKTTCIGRRHSFAVAMQKKHIESLRNKYQPLHQALETTNNDSMAQFLEKHAIMDKEEYISVLQAGTLRPTLMQQTWVNYFNTWVVLCIQATL